MKLHYWQKLLYAAGSLGVALSYQAFGTYIQFFYIDILGVKASLVGIGWSVYGIWNAVNDPLAGYLSDNTKTRWAAASRGSRACSFRSACSFTCSGCRPRR